MPKYKITWEERYSIEVDVKDKTEAREHFKALDLSEMADAYKETTMMEIEKIKEE